MSSCRCRFCQHENPADAQFCNDCGSPLTFKPCTHCDSINPVEATTCFMCEAAFEPVREPESVPVMELVTEHAAEEASPPRPPRVPESIAEFLDEMGRERSVVLPMRGRPVRSVHDREPISEDHADPDDSTEVTRSTYDEIADTAAHACSAAQEAMETAARITAPPAEDRIEPIADERAETTAKAEPPIGVVFPPISETVADEPEPDARDARAPFAEDRADPTDRLQPALTYGRPSAAFRFGLPLAGLAVLAVVGYFAYRPGMLQPAPGVAPTPPRDAVAVTPAAPAPPTAASPDVTPPANAATAPSTPSTAEPTPPARAETQETSTPAAAQARAAPAPSSPVPETPAETAAGNSTSKSAAGESAAARRPPTPSRQTARSATAPTPPQASNQSAIETQRIISRELGQFSQPTPPAPQ